MRFSNDTNLYILNKSAFYKKKQQTNKKTIEGERLTKSEVPYSSKLSREKTFANP